MAYDTYRDTNGVTWTVVWPASAKRHTAIATVMDTADPKYDPEPPDLTVSMSQGGIQLGGLDIIPSDIASGEQQRVLFLELVDKLEKYAKEHRRLVELKVTAAPPVPWWVWAFIGLAVLKRR